MRYHKDIGFPSSLVIPSKLLELVYTNHARDRQQNKYKGLKVLPTVVRVTQDNLIEVITPDDKKINRIVIRVQYDKKQMIVLVLHPHNKKANVITFWLNHKKDLHPTLKKAKYDKPYAN